MGTVVWYAATAVAEIAGCFAFWSVFRLGRSALWLAPGIASLMIFAFALTRVEAAFAGRAYAAYGGVYIAASVLWLWMIERHVPDRWDIIGSSVALCGAAIVLFGPRAV